MNSQISISYFNVNGLQNSHLGCKLDTADLVNNITRYDITRYDITRYDITRYDISIFSET